MNLPTVKAKLDKIASRPSEGLSLMIALWENFLTNFSCSTGRGCSKGGEVSGKGWSSLSSDWVKVSMISVKYTVKDYAHSVLLNYTLAARLDSNRIMTKMNIIMQVKAYTRSFLDCCYKIPLRQGNHTKNYIPIFQIISSS